jgi:hypothetical protein
VDELALRDQVKAARRSVHCVVVQRLVKGGRRYMWLPCLYVISNVFDYADALEY